MQIDGFTYVRNGLRMGYPFLASIQSLLPIVDRLIVVVGNSDDGTREAVEDLKNPKLVIIDSVWDENKRNSGEIFKVQSDIGINNLTGDWAIHIQADEVFSESAKDELLKFIKIADRLEDVDGLLFPFYHFWGDYKHIRHSRRTHANEIRAFKNNRNVLSYRDSQGFRIMDPINPDKKGRKLKVLKTGIPIYHYSYARNPKHMKIKWNYIHRFYQTDEWLEKNVLISDFDYNEVDRLDLFEGEHPIYMKEIIKQQDWKFNYDPSLSKMKLKDKILYPIEKYFNYRMFEYKNYKVKQLAIE